jgi:ribonuclease VapC
MIVDTSAIVSIVRQEADASVFAQAIIEADVVRLSAASYLEAAAVIHSKRDPVVGRRFDEFLSEMRVVVEPFTERQARIAREAYHDFGKGSGHAAKLNFGDCFAYALAKDMNEPLLFKGDDFKHTDVKSALP